ncbi:hypothetical protein KDA_70070 [Dictyobacter alpinus]|uniref:Uncharacterized protein n=1 Tax=Dictyobacter alpinus TaxID=2014873 RepID=A0A402BJL3_9CHLR|nr:hypothetical protein [Dictyobacter alpinus]GCE31523.1 hypothetical protein KDA_70070 [Dictyobacter alpinus]
MIELSLNVRDINKAADKNRVGGGGGVYCSLQGSESFHRITQAKSVRGQLVVRRLHDGHWVYPVAVYKEW